MAVMSVIAALVHSSKIHGRNRNFKLYMNDNISEIFNTVSVLIKPVPQL